MLKWKTYVDFPYKVAFEVEEGRYTSEKGGAVRSDVF